MNFPDSHVFPGGILAVSSEPSEKILYANDTLARWAGCSSAEDFLKHYGAFHELVLPLDYQPLQDLFYAPDKHGNSDTSLFDFRIVRADGHTMKLNSILSPWVTEEGKSCWVLHILNIIIPYPNRDPVTGLPTHHTFYKTAQKLGGDYNASGHFGRLTTIYINLSNFKVFNNTHGREAGHRLLHTMGSLIVNHFPGSLVGHEGADHFLILTENKDVKKSLAALNDSLQKEIQDSSITMKAGVVWPDLKMREDSRGQISYFFDLAKLAADSIKKDARKNWAFYEPSMVKRLEVQAYVLKHFEEALEKEYIKVFYQPVIRTFTGKLCSVEALSRWDDPEKGLLSPGIFIPVLERSRLITKLDCYIVEHCARRLRWLQENQRPLVPVSVNFSRADFDEIDTLAFMEKLVETYQLPRNLFCIEVTESALVEDEDKLKTEVDRFRKAGYQVWLDDFGSGYSSLNVLQNYHFDEIKIDMAFQKTNSPQSRQLLSSIVQMAKALGLHTLAEGVETREQAEFLKNIGCEKIQGFYYGMPLPYNLFYKHCLEHNLPAESRREAAVFEKTGLINTLSKAPAAIFEKSEDGFILLLMNEAFRKNISSFIYGNLPPLGIPLHLDQYPDGERLKLLISKTITTGEQESAIFVSNNQYVHCKAKITASSGDLYTGLLEITNISMDPEARNGTRLDELLRNILSMYSGIYRYVPETDRVEILSTLYPGLKAGDSIPLSEWKKLGDYIHPDDWDRMYDFMDPVRRKEIALHTDSPMVSELFRVRGDSGEYHWKEMDSIALRNGDNFDFLICVRKAPFENMIRRKETLPLVMRSLLPELTLTKALRQSRLRGSILDTLRSVKDVKCFWKDENRRFLGASRAFLDYYGLKKEEDLIGKTDEEMHWHIDGTDYKGEEEKVLTRGIPSIGCRGICLVHGKPRRIIASKYPVYRGNKIAGLMGWFTDIDEKEDQMAQDVRLGLIDEKTGIYTYRGMLMAGTNYQRNYRLNDQDYLAILMHIPGYTDFVRSYGAKAGDKLLTAVTDIMKNFFNNEGTLCYLGGTRFVAFLKDREAHRNAEPMRNLIGKIYDIHEIDGCPATLRLTYSMANGSEVHDTTELFHLLGERLTEFEKGVHVQSVYVGNRLPFDREDFDHIESLVIISDMVTHDILYMNEAALAMLQIGPERDYRKEKCYNLVCGLTHPTNTCARFHISRGSYLTNLYKRPGTDKYYLVRHALIPWKGRNCHFEIATELNGYVKRINRGDNAAPAPDACPMGETPRCISEVNAEETEK